MSGQSPRDTSMAWDWEQYNAIKMGLTQPPDWNQWQLMPWKTARRWIAFEEEMARLRELERQKQKQESPNFF